MLIWFTGMSGAGKSTLAEELKRMLQARGYKIEHVDGDVFRRLRQARNIFSKEEILENNYQIIEHCKEMIEKTDFLIVAVVSPFEETRQFARKIFGKRYFEVFVDCPVDELVKRDTKGLYKKALCQEMDNVIGFSKQIPYERPLHPDLVINTAQISLKESADILLRALFPGIK